MIATPKGNPPKKVIVIDDGKDYFEVEVPWTCTICGEQSRSDPKLEWFPATGRSFHTWTRDCNCIQNEYWSDLLDQARLFGAVISKNGVLWKAGLSKHPGVFCVKCGNYCEYETSESYVCWVCRVYPFYSSSADDD